MKSIIRNGSDLFVSTDGWVRQLKMEDIIYIEHFNRGVFFHTPEDTVSIPYISMARVRESLDDDRFLQCHRSFLVNRSYIERIDRAGNGVVLKNHMGRIALGRKYKDSVLRLLHYIE